MLKNTTQSFGSLSKCLHWLIFVLLTLQFLLIWRYNMLPKNSPEKLQDMLIHKSVGITIFMVAVIFVVWRMINIKPLPPVSEPYWKRVVAKTVHRALLSLLIILPVVGYSLSCTAGRTVSFFGLYTLPVLIPANKNLAAVLDFTHGKLGILMLIIVGIHVLAALHHHFILKDNVLKRMMPLKKAA